MLAMSGNILSWLPWPGTAVPPSTMPHVLLRPALSAALQPLAAQLEPVHVSSKAWANRVVEPVG